MPRDGGRHKIVDRPGVGVNVYKAFASWVVLDVVDYAVTLGHAQRGALNNASIRSRNNNLLTES